MNKYEIIANTKKSSVNKQTYHFRNFVAKYYASQDKWHYVPYSRVTLQSPVIKLLLANRLIYAIDNKNIFYTRHEKVNQQWKPVQLPNNASWEKVGSGTVLKNHNKGIIFGGLTSNLKHLVSFKDGISTNIETSGIPPQYYVNHMITDPVSGAVYFTTTSVRYKSSLIWPGQLLEYKDGKTSIILDTNNGGFAISSLAIGTMFTRFEQT